MGAIVQLIESNSSVKERHSSLWLHEKSGKVTELPCYHNLDQYLEVLLRMHLCQNKKRVLSVSAMRIEIGLADYLELFLRLRQ